WCAPAWCVPISIISRDTPCASSTRASASTCGRRIRRTSDLMADPASVPDISANQPGPAVSLRGVTKVYDTGVSALGPLDLDVKRGEFVSLLGPSGCGKSTALRLIAGLSTPSSGTVSVSHRDSESRAGHSIGFVFQEPTLMPWASVRDNVRL